AAVEGQQADNLHAAGDQFGGAAQHLLAIATLIEVGDQDQDGRVGPRDDLLAVAQGAVDVGAAAQAHAEEQVYRVLEILGQIDHRRIEDDHARADGFDGRQDRAEDARIYDG